MTTRRRRAGLAVVIACAIVLSFSGLYDLARLCKFHPLLALLVPVLADAGGALAADVWLDRTVERRVRRYACAIALTLIASSLLGNTASHLLAVLEAEPPWWLAALLGALAPAVVASNLHLYALVHRGGEVVVEPDVKAAAAPSVEVAEQPAEGGRVERLAERLAVAPQRLAVAGEQVFVSDADVADSDEDGEVAVLERAREMAAAGVGRPTLVKELGLKDHVARAIVQAHKPRQEARA